MTKRYFIPYYDLRWYSSGGELPENNTEEEEEETTEDTTSEINNPRQPKNWGKFLSGASGMAGGIMGMANAYQDLAGIADTSGYWNDINEVEDIGTEQYADYGDMLQDYDRLNGLQTRYDYRDIRGKNDGQIGMGIGNSVLQGFYAGASTGNPYAMAAGAVIGLGAGIMGAYAGNDKAKLEKLRLQNGAKMAQETATMNMQAANENLVDYKFRSGVSNRADWGGKIERRNQSIRQFADRVLHNQKSNDITRSAGIQRRHGDGGTIIRIKR